MGERFPTTRWSRVVAAGDRDAPESREALSSLCAAYWYPLYAFIRRKGHGPDEALDLTQEYFAGLLEKATFAVADPGKGRFRSFLPADCGHFLAHRRGHEQVLKRGGGSDPRPLPALPADVFARDGDRPTGAGRAVRRPDRSGIARGRSRPRYHEEGARPRIDVAGADDAGAADRLA